MTKQELIKNLEEMGFVYQAPILSSGQGYWKYDSIGTLAAFQELDEGYDFQISKANKAKNRVFLKGDTNNVYNSIINILKN